MMNARNILVLLVSTVVFGAVLSGCSDLNDDCDPEFDEGCVCTLDDDPNIDVSDECINGETDDQEFCTCALDEDSDEGDLADNNNDNDIDGDGVDDRSSFRFVMVEDLTRNRGGDFPGADVDAISVIKASGDEFFATSFSADTDVDCAGNLACDPSALLGAPDAVRGGSCFNGTVGSVDPTTFTALNGGFAVVQFSEGARDVSVANGDRLRVYEIGATQCNGAFDDDPYRVAVSISDDLGAFIEVGTGGQGVITIPVSGL